MPQKPEIVKSEFIKSAVVPPDYPTPDRPEVALAGRSNAGKSSLLNHLLGRNLVKVSRTPGKTKLLNFFNCGEYYRYVDLPGYGFSTSTKEEMDQWKIMIETYFAQRESLKGVILVMDIRRDWEQMEQQLVGWLNDKKIPFVVAMTKVDKLNSKELVDRKKQIRKNSSAENLFACSNLKKSGISDIENYIFNKWIKVAQ